MAASEVLLAIALVASPLAFGATEAWSQLLLIALVMAALVVLAIDRVIDRESRIVASWAYVPMLLFVGLVAFQLVPLPRGVVEWVSPGTMEYRRAVLAGLPSDGVTPSWLTLSLYPHGTQVQLRLLLLTVAVFVLVTNLVKTREQFGRGLWVLVATGVPVVGLVFYQSMMGPIAVFDGSGHPYAGPFLNRGHAAQLVILSMAGAVGLLLMEVGHLQKMGISSRRFMRSDRARPHRRRLLGLLAYTVVAATAVFLTLSRGGIIAMLASGLLVGAYFAWRGNKGSRKKRSNGSLVLIIGLLVFMMLLVFGFDLIYERLATIGELEEAYGERWDILTDLRPAWAQFPLFGTGLGSFVYVFAFYDRGVFYGVTTHAENEYAHLLLETGGLGLLLIFAFLGWVLTQGIRATWRMPRTASFATIGLLFGLIAVLIHSFSDFGQHVPAVAISTAVVCALICRVGRWVTPTPKIAAQRSSRAGALLRWNRTGRLGLTAALAIGGLIWLSHANTARQAEAQAIAATQLASAMLPDPSTATDDQFIALISTAQAAADLQPRNAETLFDLTLYRWWAVSRGVGQQADGELVMADAEIGFTRRIVDDLHRVRALCPAHGPAALLAGELSQDILDDPAGAELIAVGQRLSPHDQRAVMLAARVAIDQNDIQRAEELLHRAAQLGSGPSVAVMQAFVEDLNQPEAAFLLAQDDRALMLRLVQILGEAPEHADIANRAQQEAHQLLLKDAASDDPAPSTLATLGQTYAREGDHTQAAGFLRRAVALQYGQVQWRVQLAESLAATGELEEALREAKIALRLRPGHTGAQRLIDQLAGQVEDQRVRG